MNTDQTVTPAEVAAHIARLSARIRTRSRILEGTGLSRGHNPNPANVAAMEEEQRATLDALAAELAHWEGIRDQNQTGAEAEEYVVPVDPMDELNCDSCQ